MKSEAREVVGHETSHKDSFVISTKSNSDPNHHPPFTVGSHIKTANYLSWRNF